MKIFKVVLHLVLIASICFVAYLVAMSVNKPLQFNSEKDRRYNATIDRLKEIRTAQIAFRSENRRFTGCFDTLIDFLKTGEFTVVRIVGDLDDSLAVATGQIFRDTIKIPVLDSLFRKGYNVDSIRFVPYTQGVEFELGCSILKAGNVDVPVFEAKIENDILLQGLDPQLLVNFNADRRLKTGYAGLKVGSLTETTNNAGNWE